MSRPWMVPTLAGVVLLASLVAGLVWLEPATSGQSWLLGVIEGLTEYLPVSSTGHLVIAQKVMGIGSESAEAKKAADAYAVCIQGGAILAVLGLYWRRVQQALVGWAGKVKLGPGDETGFRLGLNLIVAFLPAAIIGLLFDDLIESYLFGPWPIVVAWFVGGLAILVVAWWKKRQSGDEHVGKELDGMTWRMALVIGLIQCLAMWPGTSRSLVTIVGGVLVGLHLAAAVEFSFLLGVITLCAATIYKAREAGPLMLETYGWGPLLVGSLAAWASAVFAVQWMVGYLKKHGMELFGYYRIAIALLIAALLLAL
jgi:undecaprenyl-diphosphatase